MATSSDWGSGVERLKQIRHRLAERGLITYIYQMAPDAALAFERERAFFEALLDAVPPA
jgi:hypothetical protein